jgi:prophage antirepressor-like protein
MAQKLIDIYNHVLAYNNENVYIAFDDETMEPYFHAKQLCEMLEYVDYKQTLRINISKKDIFYLKDIVKNYKILYKNVQGHTKFLNEAGMYSLLIKSKKPIAKEITEWITHVVMPSIRKYGEYKLTHSLKKQIDQLKEELIEKANENEVLKHNLRNPKFAKGGMVYLLRTIDNKISFDPNQKTYLKFGRTKDMNKRKPIYDTSSKNKVQVIKSILVKNPKNIEQCVIAKMDEYKIKNKKEYFECSYNQIIKEIASCIKFYENIDINIKPDIDIQEMNRQTNTQFDVDEKMTIKILSDDEFDEMFETSKDSESDNEMFETSEDSESDNENDEDNNQQYGGNANVYIDYLAYKLKYLELKYDLL